MATRNFPTSYQLTWIGDLVTSLAGATVHLLKDQLSLLASDAVATYTPHEADYTGYAAVVNTAATPGAPDGVNGGVFTQIPTAEFAVGATPVATNTIYGFWIQTSGMSPVLILSANFNSPISMVAPLSQLNLDVVQNLFGVFNAAADPTIVAVNGLPN